MAADNKSSLVQIAQAVLDEATQSLKVRLDSQSVQINVNLDENEDAVTVYQSADPWEVEHITEAVATAARQDTQTTKLEEVRVATIAAKDAAIAAKVAVESVDAKVSTAAKQDSQTLELQAIKGHVDELEIALNSVDDKLYSTLVSGNSSLHVTVDNQTTGLATEAKQDTQITELQAIKGHVDQVEAKLDSAITELTALNSKSARLDAIHTSYLDYGTTNVTNAAWVTLATVPANVEVREIAIFDSSGEVGEIGVVATVGDTPTTVRTLIFPGGNMPMPIVLTAGQVLKIRAKSTILNTGVCVINYYGVSTL
jgi:hypothetical protein